MQETLCPTAFPGVLEDNACHSKSRLRPRPLSPHLAVYRRTMTMMMSIAHRLTGTALYFGTLLLTWWLIAAAEGPKSYRLFESCIGSPPGKFVLLCYPYAIFARPLPLASDPIAPRGPMPVNASRARETYRRG
jgi:Succinate dehydrogenase/Fumarate reductase transmembrane subunit